ncbi:hypothetical protein QBC34DRAFT_132891 [Podospora aff. communis PSN243]|uniref:Fungal N-terminal domain-containing protein n=1 Tax=Podospora aff. communis PSN243 TaxID=3040156 RepID=A0AAV9GJK1_9PEZI|nr:hypothetical protein QBC34DRAFT_132891 [Podospora aff. communis PSN243]
MEVVGLSAAALSITKAIQSLVRFTNFLYRAAKDSPRVAQQIRQFALSVRNPAEAAKLAIMSLTKEKFDLGSPVIQHMKKINHLQDLEEETRHLHACVNGFRKRVLKINSRWDVVTSIRWGMLKPDMEAELSAPLSNLVATLSLTVNVIRLEEWLARRRENPTESIEEEIQEMKNTIVGLLESVRQLREDMHYTPPVTRRETNGSRGTVDSQITLCHLAHNMVERESVPSSPPETFTFAKVKRKRHSRSFSGASTISSAPSRHRPRVDSPNISPPRRPPPEPPSIPIPNLEPSPWWVGPLPPEQGNRAPSPPPREARASVEQRDTPVRVEPERMPSPELPAPPPPQVVPPGEGSSSKSDETTASSSSVPKSPGEARTAAISTTSPEPRRRRTRRTSPPEQEVEIPRSRTDLHLSVITGWITTQSGNRMVEAFIDRRQRCNLISRHHQEQLGLELEAHEDGLSHEVRRFGGRTLRTLGVVTLLWRNESVPVRCFVLEELERPLIFGRPFQYS